MDAIRVCSFSLSALIPTSCPSPLYRGTWAQTLCVPYPWALKTRENICLSVSRYGSLRKGHELGLAWGLELEILIGSTLHTHSSGPQPPSGNGEG